MMAGATMMPKSFADNWGTAELNTSVQVRILAKEGVLFGWMISLVLGTRQASDGVLTTVGGVTIVLTHKMLVSSAIKVP